MQLQESYIKEYAEDLNTLVNIRSIFKIQYFAQLKKAEQQQKWENLPRQKKSNNRIFLVGFLNFLFCVLVGFYFVLSCFGFGLVWFLQVQRCILMLMNR